MKKSSDRFNRTYWEDLRVPMHSIKLGGVKDPGFDTFKDTTLAYAFAGDAIAANEEKIYFCCQIPHSYMPGSSIEPHVHWAPISANAGNIQWQLEYTWANIDSVCGNTTNIYAIDACAGAALTHQIAEFPEISGTNKGISSMLVCKLQRNSANAADTYAEDIFLLEFDFHFRRNTPGSRLEFTK